MPSTFDEACAALETALTGSLRQDIVDAAARLQPLGRALGELRSGMRSHHWRAANRPVDLGPLIDDLDRRTRADGLHVLYDWDGKAGRVTPNSIAGDVVELAIDVRGEAPTERTAIALAIDFYFLYVLALLAMRSWDTADPAAALDRVTGLVRHLQGPAGSGQRFADNAETLLLIATSHYEPNEQGYDTLLRRARALPQANRTAMALTHAQAMGGHLRFGYEVTYGLDVKAMRDDNGADYPWVCFGLAGLMDEFARMAEAGQTGPARDRVVEGVINALTPDPEAFVERPPASLDAHREEFERFRTLFDRYRAELVEAFDAHRPRDHAYSPIALYFNFSQNVLKGTVVDALVRGQAWDVSLNDLFTARPTDEDRSAVKTTLARRLMGYARANPDTIRGRLSPVIVYDPIAGRRSFGAAMRVIKRGA